MSGELIEGFDPASNPLLLPTATIYVPNRRAARALTEAFVKRFEGSATLLPKIRTLGDVDDDEFDLETSIELANALPQSINSLERNGEVGYFIDL